jgi:hypothetical protein
MKELTAGQITRDAMLMLEDRNCFVWRNNNLAVPGRKFTGLKGVSDIIGFQKISGIAVYVEVKTKNDKVSEYQRNFMIRAKTAGCIVLIAYDDEGKTNLKTWQ